MRKKYFKMNWTPLMKINTPLDVSFRDKKLINIDNKMYVWHFYIPNM